VLRVVLLALVGSAETVVKILHVNPVPEVLEIWQAAAVEFEKVHPPIKVLLLETPKSNFPPEPLPERLYSAKISRALWLVRFSG
jgi:hypothetical protein